MRKEADRTDILNILNRRIRKLKKKVYCKHHKILLEPSYDNMAECPKNTQKCSACSNDDLASYDELLKLKEAICKRDFNLRNQWRQSK